MINQSIKVEQNLMWLSTAPSVFSWVDRSILWWVLYGAEKCLREWQLRKSVMLVCGFICANLVGNRDISRFVTGCCFSAEARSPQDVTPMI